MDGLSHREVMEGVFHIGDGRGNFCTLLAGSAGAILYDTMMGLGDLRAYVAGLTGFSPMVINSHCHFDHVGGNFQFDRVYMSEADFPLMDVGLSELPILKETQGMDFSYMVPSFTDKSRVRPLAAGAVIDLGGLTAEVVALPGHTPGSLGLLIREQSLLLAGDAISPQACLFFPESSLSDYAKTLEMLKSVPFDHFLLAHFDYLFPKAKLDRFAQCLDLIGKKRSQEYVFSPVPTLGGRLFVLDPFDPETHELVGIFVKNSDAGDYTSPRKRRK